MNASRSTWRAVGVVMLLASGGCATVQPYDYTAFNANPPRSILVLPPINESTAVEGTFGYLSTISRPLAERGYYVFPVDVIDRLMRENGLPTAGEMHEVSPARLREITGADAVLYCVLNQYGSKFVLLSANTQVQVTARLVDTRTGTVLWDGVGLAQQGTGGSGSLLADLVAAAVTQVVNSQTDPAHGASTVANAVLFGTPKRELPQGPLVPVAANRR
jgi:hypothetical protein